MGGGSPSIPQISATNTLGSAFNIFNKQEIPAYNQFVQSQPLLQNASNLAQGVNQPLSDYVTQIIQSQGALTPQMQRESDQATRARFQAQGGTTGLTSNPEIFSEALNRDTLRQQRMAQAVGLAGQAENLQIAPEQAQVGSFATLLNPILGATTDIAAANQNAAAAQSIAGANKSSGAVGGGLGAVGAIGGGLAIAL